MISGKLNNFAITKWAGGKNSELIYIKEYYPKRRVDRFIEPFVGGGSVFGFFSSQNLANSFFVNDLSEHLINLYTMVKKQDEIFFSCIDKINDLWKQAEELARGQIKKGGIYKEFKCYTINKITEQNFRDFLSSEFLLNSKNINSLFNPPFNNQILRKVGLLEEIFFKKFDKIKNLENTIGAKFTRKDIDSTIQACYKSFIYTILRDMFNEFSFSSNSDKGMTTALFFFIREYCYGSMFRFNSNGGFNVPYGGIAYNSKRISDKTNKLSELSNLYRKNDVSFYNLDFFDFLQSFDLNENDFLFLDPPYTTNFSTYDNNEFTKQMHIKLRNFLLTTKANFMLIINKDEFIDDLYEDSHFVKNFYKKKYSVNIKNRNSQDIVHLVITNYKL